MNRSRLRLRRPHAWPSPIPIGNAYSLPKPIAALIFLLFAMAWIWTDIAVAAGRFDGDYRGMFSFTGGQGWGIGQAYGPNCDNSKLEQVMSVSGERVYIDRKSAYPGRSLVLSGTVSADGSVSGSGAENQDAGHTIFFTLVGKIENGGFTGQVSSRNCSYTVHLTR